MKHHRTFLTALFSLSLLGSTLCHADKNIVSNGDFEKDGKNPASPDGWSGGGGVEYPKEGANRFLRIKSPAPGKMVMVNRECNIPPGTKALEMTWKQRTTNLKAGKEAWFDARILMEFKDAEGKKMPGSPSAPYTRGNNATWKENTKQFLVPEGAAKLVLMPCLFQVVSGTFDLDEISIKPISEQAIVSKKKKEDAQKAASMVPKEEVKEANWPKELKVSGNRLVDTEGKEVWLQGVSIPSMEWSKTGEQIEKSTVVAIEDWKSNVMRLPVKDIYWFDGKDGKAYRELVDRIVILASNRGAYVVLDLHTYRAPRMQDIAFWTDAASRYKNHPAVLFDIINEPHSISWEVWRNGGFVEEGKKEGDEDAFLTDAEKKANKRGFESPGMQKMVETVRATGAKNIIVAGGLDWAYDLSGITEGFALEDKEGNGIMYASHIYPWKKDWQEMMLNAAALHPILLGETGADSKKMTWMPASSQEDAETWVPAILGLIQKYRLNWTGWCFHPSASPRMLQDWDYTPTKPWGEAAKAALSGKKFEFQGLR